MAKRKNKNKKNKLSLANDGYSKQLSYIKSNNEKEDSLLNLNLVFNQEEKNKHFVILYLPYANIFEEGILTGKQLMKDLSNFQAINMVDFYKEILSESNFRIFKKCYSFLKTSFESADKGGEAQYSQISLCLFKLGDIFLKEYNLRINNFSAQPEISLELITSAYKYYNHGFKMFNDPRNINYIKNTLKDNVAQEKKDELLKIYADLKDISLQKIVDECENAIKAENGINLEFKRKIYNIALKTLECQLFAKLKYIQSDFLASEEDKASSIATCDKLKYFKHELPILMLKQEEQRLKEVNKKESEKLKEQNLLADQIAKELIQAEEAEKKTKHKNKIIHTKPQHDKEVIRIVEEKDDSDNEFEINVQIVKKEITHSREKIINARELLKLNQYDEAEQEFRKADQLAKNNNDRLEALLGIADSNNALAKEKLKESEALEPLFQQDLLKSAQSKLLNAIKYYKSLIFKLQNRKTLTDNILGNTYNKDDVVELIYTNIDSCEKEVNTIKNIIILNINLLKNNKEKYEARREEKYVELGIQRFADDMKAQNIGIIIPSQWKQNELLKYLHFHFGLTKEVIREVGIYIWNHRYDHLPSEVRLEIMSNSKGVKIKKALKFYTNLQTKNKVIHEEIELIKENIKINNEAEPCYKIDLPVKNDKLPTDNIWNKFKIEEIFETTSKDNYEHDDEKLIADQKIINPFPFIEGSGDVGLVGDEHNQAIL
jgi:hypothetical protein